MEGLSGSEAAVTLIMASPEAADAAPPRVIERQVRSYVTPDGKKMRLCYGHGAFLEESKFYSSSLLHGAGPARIRPRWHHRVFL